MVVVEWVIEFDFSVVFVVLINGVFWGVDDNVVCFVTVVSCVVDFVSCGWWCFWLVFGVGVIDFGIIVE